MPAATKVRLYVIAASLIFVGITSLSVLWWSVLQPDVLTAMDTAIQQWLEERQTATLTVVMIVFTEMFGPIALPIIVLAVVVIWGVRSDRSWRPFLLAAGTLTGVIIVQIITRVVGRSRPPEDLMLYGPDTTFSFPSGHVLGVADFFLILTFLVFSRRNTPQLAAISYVAAALLVIATALSRLYLGYHWTSDVLASMALSLVILGTVIAVDTYRTARVAPGAHSVVSG
ncbi:phosphatase PAP2 family protein [Salinibacterium sp. PAMC 21357]|uniref:phosphatase PAP2 family protein n=1 Tax=Salinibacterium sp. PAMC 21357 TaxID=1112215 RepID=UPI00192B603F|nr:phosphatase PAP2 family protein [Salinibacterium sp. PAMC 21357]